MSSRDAFEFWRIFSKEDGSSSMERIDFDMTAGKTGSLHSKPFDLVCGSPESIHVAYHAPGHINPWHTAGHRQLIVTLAGERELETSDGQVLVTRPGIVELVEDREGTGHHMRSRGDQGRLCLIIPLADPPEGS